MYSTLIHDTSTKDGIIGYCFVKDWGIKVSYVSRYWSNIYRVPRSGVYKIDKMTCSPCFKF